MNGDYRTLLIHGNDWREDDILDIHLMRLFQNSPSPAVH